MPEFKEGKAWTPVPQFGGWDKKSGPADYSMVFSRARADRKLHKYVFARPTSNDEELLPRRHRDEASPPRRKRLLRCFSCCGRM